MPKDSPKPGSGKGARTEVIVETALDAEEERTLRALHGSVVADDFPLRQKDDGLPDSVAAQLRALELKAFERADRLASLTAELDEAEVQEQERDATRDRIVSALKKSGRE